MKDTEEYCNSFMWHTLYYLLVMFFLPNVRLLPEGGIQVTKKIRPITQAALANPENENGREKTVYNCGRNGIYPIRFHPYLHGCTLMF